MNKQHFNKIKRRPVSEDDLKDALEQVLLAPRGKVRSENREPTKEELEKKWRLDRENNDT